MAERETGTVKKWNEKGFGFIIRDRMGDSIFVHARDTVDRQALIAGSKVSFIYEADDKGGKAREVAVEELGEASAADEGLREMGTVKRWNADKGFGFIGRLNGEADAFFHKKSYGGSGEPFVGQAVSFLYEEGPKGAAAAKVQEEAGGVAVEEAPAEDEGPREMGTVKRWNAEKGFGFIGRANEEEDAFFHKRSYTGSDEPQIGQSVSFVFEQGAKGASAVKVREEEGGVTEIAEEDEGEREYGKVKTYNEEKAFAFIIRCVDATEIFGHKREFPQDVEPKVQQLVSFVFEVTEKGGTAKRIRLEESIPDIAYSDEGRDFGIIKNYNQEKNFGFIVAHKDREDVRFFEKALHEVNPQKNTCVSFVREEGDKGPLAKDLREEDPERVARVTAKVHYGKVVIYKDPPETKPDSGYGFIVELDQIHLKKPKKHYFHMWEIMTPDEAGGIDLNTTVSFIIVPAKKGFQAANVTIADPPGKEDPAKENENSLVDAMAGMNVAESNGTATGDDAAGDTWGAATEDGGWGTGDGKETTTDATGGGGWGSGDGKEISNDTNTGGGGWGASDDVAETAAEGKEVEWGTGGGW